MTIRTTILSRPILFGAFIGVIIFILMFSMELWAPRIGDDLGEHKRLAQAVVFTLFNFSILINSLWGQRRSRAFLPTFFVLLVLHVVGVFYYSVLVQPILVWQWPVLGVLEYYAVAFFLYWTRHHHHSGKHRTADTEANEPS